MQTLEELKAENAKLEAAQANQAAEVDLQEVEQPNEEPEQEEGEASDESTEAQGGEVEEWLKSDSAQAVPLAKHVELKHKLKARLSEKDDAIEQLKAEIAALKSGGVMNQQQQPQQPVKVPKLSDFDYDEDKYAEAMADYSTQLVEKKFQSFASNSQQQQQQQLVQQQREKALDSHYERAQQLVEAGKISPDVYRSAEQSLRQTLQQITGNGDSVADEMISRLGDGSAKVIAHLGINQGAMAMLQKKLIDDPTGLSAAVYLGQLEAKFSGVATNKLSKAPAPESNVRATAPTGTATSESLKRAYQSASKSGNAQKAFDVRQQARAQGVNTSNW